MSTAGARRGVGIGNDYPYDEIPPDESAVLVVDRENKTARWLTASPTDDHQPFSSMLYQNAGIYVGQRALDKWKFTLTSNRTVVFLGDSLGQAAVKGHDGWVERLARMLGAKYGPRLTAGAGYYGLYRSGNTGGFTNTDREWYVNPNSAFAALAITDGAQLGPYLSAMKSAGSATRDLSCTPTANSRTLASAALFVSGDVGSLVSGVGIPPNTFVTSFTDTSNVVLSRPAHSSPGAQTLRFHKDIIEWKRPIATNNTGVQVYDAVTVNLDPTVASVTANFKGMHIGAMVTGTNIPANTTVASINSPSSIELSVGAGGSFSGGHLTVHDGRTVTDCVTTASTTITSETAEFDADDQNCKVVGLNIAAGSYIVRVISERQVVLNNAATAGGGFLFIQNNANGRNVVDMATTAGSATITSATAAFSPGDVNRPITGAGVPSNTFIQSVTNSTTAVLTNLMAFTTTGCDMQLGAFSTTSTSELQILWVNNVGGNGAEFIYSTDGGVRWTAVPQSASGAQRLQTLSVAATNPESLLIAAETSLFAASQTVQAGVFAYERSSSAFSGLRLYNISRDGQSLTNACQGGVGDPLAILDAGDGSFVGIEPDLFIVLFTNDVTQGTQQTYWNAVNRLIARTNRYADILFIVNFEQAPSSAVGRATKLQRRFAQLLKKAALETPIPYWYAADGATTISTPTITSATISFNQSDIGKSIVGQDIPAGTVITAVASATSATMSQNATATHVNDCSFQIRAARVDTENAVLDLYEAWQAQGIRGYADANKQGLMADTLHQSQLGHNDMARRVGTLLEMFS